MSEPKNFLARWSERKRHRDAGKSVPEPKEPAPAAIDKASRVSPAPEPEFDISTLPSLDSITAQSDIRAFLQRGVPAELTRAALRRVWSADPAIRDFVGLAENSWDFNAPDSIPGFASSLSASELKQAAAQLLDELPKDKEEAAPPESGGEIEKTQIDSAQTDTPDESGGQDASSTGGQREVHAASQHGETAAPINFARQPRRHGGALPE